MENIQCFKVVLFNMSLLSLFILCVFSKSQQIVRKLDLFEGMLVSVNAYMS